ncbi:putative quinol monooxygenase [Leifsonia sp. NPDC058292]|uniref:putative quinol monooxygenase n=1 Tax=Leifsonia sp. NPDC058292 TaxID=3346428 RepID=UPI0036DBC639
MSDARFLYAEIDALPGAEDDVASLLTDYALRVRAEPGNRRFDVFTMANREGRFFVYEEYESTAAFQAHESADYCAVLNRQLETLAAGGQSRLTWLEPVE